MIDYEKASVRMTEDGLIYCANCGELLTCDQNGDMPVSCPACGCILDYGGFRAPLGEATREMTLGEAAGIFCSIDQDISDELKGTAIWKVLNMETHNGIPKKAMLEVIRYLMGLCFDIEEEATK